MARLRFPLAHWHRPDARYLQDHPCPAAPGSRPDALTPSHPCDPDAHPRHRH